MKRTMNYLASVAITIALIGVASCGGSDPLPKIDGYNNSNEVAAANLVAHWTFDSDNKEAISGTAPSNTFGTVGSEAGQIGNALKLTKGVLVYPPITAINTANALNNFTVSMWVKVSGNKKTASEGFTAFFGLIPTGVTDIWGDVMACAETSWHLPSSDTLVLKNLLNTHLVGGGNSMQDNVAVKNGNAGADFKGANKWSHYVMVWDATTNKFYIYGDAVDVGGYTQRASTGVEIMAVPVKPVFGSLASSNIGFSGAPAQVSWNPYATASIDDVRIFNTALSAVEITALFNLGKAGR